DVQQRATKGGYSKSKLDDFNYRQQNAARYAQEEISKAQRAQVYQSELPTGTEPVAMKPLWAEERLLLVRRIERYGRPVLQGVWIDWPKLKQQLLGEVMDLVPGADLVPAHNPDEVDVATLLASLPVSLEVPAEEVVATVRPPTRAALGIG